ncbi:hypothetical protein P7C70_g494, partial [Phenoliferia sp. Uapishka_3]
MDDFPNALRDAKALLTSTMPVRFGSPSELGNQPFSFAPVLPSKPATPASTSTSTSSSAGANNNTSPSSTPTNSPAPWTTETVTSTPFSTSSAPKVDITESRYSRERARMMTLINALTASGASLELDVPRIAIIGNQSAGKSSLVEAISGIAVPRDAGTCTRTPYEVQLKSSTLAWSCQISIRILVDQHGVEQAPRQFQFGPTLVDPAQVEPMLRKAQLAILNPGAEPSFFVNLSQESINRINSGELPSGCTKQLSFSRNLVCVEIEGPDAVDLTFVDLPGIISNVKPGDDPNDIELVRNLVKRHITGNCLILCAYSMKDDLENQSCGRLAHEADPEGVRTIGEVSTSFHKFRQQQNEMLLTAVLLGVLTKADTLQEGEHSRWLKVLRGESHQLALGYFCTKLRGTADLQGGNVSYEASRAAEATFFSTVAPWESLKGDIRQRLGTKSLVDFLGDRLSLFMSTKIPELISKTSSQLADVSSQLSKLPPPPSRDPVIQLGSMIDEFVTALQGYAVGAAGYKSLVQDVGEKLDDFKLDIQATEPRFTPFSGEGKRREDWERNSVAITSSDKGRVAGSITVETRKRRIEALGEEISGVRTDDFVLEMDLDQVQSRIKKARTRELPMNVPYDTKTDLVALSLQGWPSIIDACLERVRPIVHHTVHQLILTHFSRYDQSSLCSMVRATMSAHLDLLFKKCREHLDYFVSLEKTTTTRNTHFHTSTYDHLVGLLNGARKDPPARDLVDMMVAAALTGGRRISAEDVVKMLNGQDFAEEIDAMASVQAYWKRIIDNVPRAIDADIIQRLHEDAHRLLVKKVGLYEPDASERATRLVSEKASITKERNELAGRMKRLEEARELLSDFDEQKSV